MNPQRLLEYAVATVTIIGVMMLGLSQGKLVLPLAAILVAGTALYFTDARGWFRLNGAMANFAALAAVAVTVFDMSHAEDEQHLMAVSNLLIYLQVILLYQEKTVRVGWQLLSLSLLEAVVSAVLYDSLVFALLLALYLVTAIVTMLLLAACAQLAKHSRQFVVSSGSADDDWSGGRRGRRNASRAVIDIRTLAGSSGRVLAAGLTRHTLTTLGVTAVVAAFIFTLLPRTGRTRSGSALRSQAVSGFSSSIALADQLRRITLDDEIVMRVRLFDEATGEPIQALTELYFRGAVSSIYTNGEWTAVRSNSQNWPPPADLYPNVVRQQIDLERMRHKTLFSIYPVVQLENAPADDRIEYQQPLYRIDNQNPTREPYILGTAGIIGGRQVPIIPLDPDAQVPAPATLPGEMGDEPDQFAALRKRAADAVTRAGAEDTRAKAIALQRYLRDSGEFRYTLIPPLREKNVDPNEDFCSKNPQGHCENFASALALMLRSQGIRSRVVMGYRTTEWNSLGGYYQVRGLHAHAWVEAFLEKDEIPDSAKNPQKLFDRGGWLRLDPTPGDDFDLALAANSPWQMLKNLFDHADLLWRNQVVNFTWRRQGETSPFPLAERLIRFLRREDDGVPGTSRQRTSNDSNTPEGRGLFTEIGTTLILLFPLVLFLLAITATWAWRRARVKRRAARAAGGLAGAEFYQRMETLLARRGLRRSPAQTPREFAQTVAAAWAEEPSRRGAARVPRKIVEAFYHVRYGGRDLDEAMTAEMDEHLRALGVAVRDV